MTTTPHVWKSFNNFEFTEISFFTEKKVLVIHDTLSNKFYLSADNIVSACGYTSIDSKRRFNDCYSKHVRFIHFEYFDTHNFVSLHEVPVIFEVMMNSAHRARKEFIQSFMANLPTKLNDSFNNRVVRKTRAKNTQKQMKFEGKFIDYRYINSKLMLNLRGTMEAVGMSRTAGLSSYIKTLSVVYNNRRYIDIEFLPIMIFNTTVIENREAISRLFHTASKLYKGSQQSRKIIFKKELKVALYNQQCIPLNFDYDDVMYSVGALSHAIGLKGSSKGLRGCGIQLDDNTYVSKDDIRDYIDSKNTTLDIRKKLNEFVRVAV